MSIRRLLIMTGDPSGDIHAANVVQALRRQGAAAGITLEITAVGGQALQAAGVTLLSDQSQMARIGFGAVTGAWFHYRLGRRILRYLETFQPQGILLIDYGGFNLWMAAQLKKKGYRVYYYIPPQVWATRRGRIHQIKRSVDRVFCIFPFETPLYESYGIPVTYVGHPLVGQLPPPVNRQAFCAQYGLDADPAKKIIALLPGSRQSEIQYLLRPMLETLPILLEKMANSAPKNSSLPQFVLSQATSLNAADFTERVRRVSESIPNLPPLTIVAGATHALQSVADAALVASGTATLETALYGTPMVIVYRLQPIVGWLARRLLYLPYIGLPNILADAPIVPELVQEGVKPEAIATALLPLLNSELPETRQACRAFEEIQTVLGQNQAADSVAKALLQELIKI